MPTDNLYTGLMAEMRDYLAEVLDDAIVVRCRKCGAAAVIAANSFTAANAFLETKHLTLQ